MRPIWMKVDVNQHTCALKIRLAGTWRNAERVIPFKATIFLEYFLQSEHMRWAKVDLWGQVCETQEFILVINYYMIFHMNN